MKNILYAIILSFLFSFSVFSEDGVKKLFDVEKQSAEQGNVKGQFNLGWMYNNGLGVTQDYKEAANRDRIALQHFPVQRVGSIFLKQSHNHLLYKLPYLLENQLL